MYIFEPHDLHKAQLKSRLLLQFMDLSVELQLPNLGPYVLPLLYLGDNEELLHSVFSLKSGMFSLLF